MLLRFKTGIGFAGIGYPQRNIFSGNGRTRRDIEIEIQNLRARANRKLHEANQCQLISEELVKFANSLERILAADKAKKDE